MASNTEIARSRGIIAHELAHVRRRDHWVASLELVGGVLWWWNPLFWFVRRRLRETAEIACDALAIATSHGSRREYAEMLLELSAGFQSAAPVPVLAVSAGARPSFERRLCMILSDRVSGNVPAWGILAAIAFALVALPGWSLGQQKEPTKEQPPAVEQRVSTPQKQQKVSNKDLDDLQGEWAVVAMDYDGAKVSADELEGMTRWMIEGNEIAGFGRTDAPGKVSFRLDPARSPKEIDITIVDGLSKGDRAKGIYAIEGRSLRVCLSAQSRPDNQFATEPGGGLSAESRPKRFATAPGSGRYMITLEKCRPVAPAGSDDLFKQRAAPQSSQPTTDYPFRAGSVNNEADEPLFVFPDNPPPLQLIARLIDESLTITVPTTIRVVGSSETIHTIAKTELNLKEVQAFDTTGKRIEVKKLRILLRENTDVLVSADGRPVDPFYLRLVKEGTVVLLLFEPGDFFEMCRIAKPEVTLRRHERVEAVPMPTPEGSKAGDRKELVPEIAFRWCPAGKFKMGEGDDAIDVLLSQGFWLGETEVTQGQWKKLMGTSPWSGRTGVGARASTDTTPPKEGPDYAASYISYDDALSFCEKLTTQEQGAGRLPKTWEYSLPTEAQWEYACRAGTKTRFSFGDDESNLNQYAWFGDNVDNVKEPYAHKIGLKKQNAWGLRDIHGNVWEWCSDWYASKRSGGKAPVGPTAPRLAGSPPVPVGATTPPPPDGSSGKNRVVRGGSWIDPPLGCTSANRFYSNPRRGNSVQGFRIAAGPSSE